MSVSIDVAWKSLNKDQEELCGDQVEVLKTDDSDIVILADGMGSGVKANILATLTSKILGTMLHEGAALEDCVETVARTLPICKVRKTAYATFSISRSSTAERPAWPSLTIRPVYSSGMERSSITHMR